MKNSSHYTNRKLVRLLFTMLVVAAWVTACGNPASETPVTEEPATEEPTTEPTQEPDRQACDGADGNFTCQGLNGHEITLEGLPGGVTPYLLSISPEFEAFLLGPNAKRSPETACIFMLAGDLAFYDDNEELITRFDPPITINYYFLLDVDNDAFQNCQTEAAAAANISPEEVEYVPFYYHKETWRPFKDAVVDTQSGLMTITFTTWGDQPIGGGTKP